MRWTGAAMLLFAAPVACHDRAMMIPSPPANMVEPDRLPFGDALAAVEGDRLTEVLGTLQPRFGRPKVSHLVGNAAASEATVKAHYLSAANGWTPLRGLPEGTFGFASGKTAFAIIVLPRYPGDPHLYVTTVSFGSAETSE